MSEVILRDKGWSMWCQFGDGNYLGSIVIDNLMKYIENIIAIGITHETLHLLIRKIESRETSEKFDNIFGTIDYSILLCPEEDSEYYKINLERIKKIKSYGKWNE